MVVALNVGLRVQFMKEVGLRMRCMDGVTRFAQEMEDRMDSMKVSVVGGGLFLLSL
jgi:hypothetical protein